MIEFTKLPSVIIKICSAVHIATERKIKYCPYDESVQPALTMVYYVVQTDSEKHLGEIKPCLATNLMRKKYEKTSSHKSVDGLSRIFLVPIRQLIDEFQFDSLMNELIESNVLIDRVRGIYQY